MHFFLKFKNIIVIILLLSMLLAPVSYASLAGKAQSESGPMPYYTPPDDPGGPPSPSPGEEEHVVRIPHNRYISGNVYEDIGVTSDIVTISKIGIGGIYVELIYNSTGTVLASQMTDEDGNYSFDMDDLGLPSGSYNLRFIYGNLDISASEANSSSTITVGNVLYYNGYDYIVTETPFLNKIDIIEEEIIRSGKSAAQVYLLIDASESMRDNMVTIGGVTQRRLDTAVDSAKVLTQRLLAEGDNIYIGVVVFAGTCYRACSLTKNVDILLDCLEEIKSIPDDCLAGNTNIVRALEKADNSFYIDETDPDYKENSNRNIIMVTDGIPTADGISDPVYNNEPDYQTLNKLYHHIGPNTRSELTSLLNDDINIMTLICPGLEQEELDFMNTIYEEGSSVDILKVAEDDSELIDTIKNQVYEWIMSSIHDIVTIRDVEISGYEDPTRRAIVDKNFDSVMYYYLTVNGNTGDIDTSDPLSYKSAIFKQVENNTTLYSYKSGLFASLFGPDYDDAKTLSDATWMSVICGSYDIDEPVPDPADYYVTEPNPEYTGPDDTEHPATIDVHYIHYKTGYAGQDITLSRRPDFALVTKVYATGLRITLADGTQFTAKLEKASSTTWDLITDIILPNGMTTNHMVKNITMPGGSAPILLESMDSTLCQGAQVDIEFTIEVKNDSAAVCKYLEIINYLPEGFTYIESHRIVTEDKVNSDYGWVSGSLGDFFNLNSIDPMSLKNSAVANGDNLINFISYTIFDFLNRAKTVKLKTTEEILPGNSYVCKVVASKVLSSESDMPTDIEDDAEVLGYRSEFSTSTGIFTRRMVKSTFDSNTRRYHMNGIYPGDTRDQDYSKNINKASVIPPTGLGN